MRKLILITAMVAGILGAFLIIPKDADAVPVFARKYGTSCQTCHTAFPQLTPFGQAFKRNGLRFPEGTDPDMTKDDPTRLGAPAYKKVFPEAVWPGEVPGNVPLALTISSTMLYAPEDKAEGVPDDNVSFDGVGANVSLLTAGTLGERISFWAGVGFSSGGEAELERVYAQFNLFEEPSLNIKVGQFEPGLTEVSIHRSILPGYWFLTRPIGDNLWAPEPAQQGIELNGILASGRFGYNAGIVEGGGNEQNKEKDVYGRILYKIGGMRLDGVSKDDDEEGGTSLPKPWRDDSITLSGFGYSGLALVGDPDPAGVSQDDQFFRIGGDISANYWNIFLAAGYAFQHNERPLLDEPERDADTSLIFAECGWVAYPWLIPIVRYENFDSDLLIEAEQRVTAGVIGLVRANVRVRVHVDFQDKENDDFEAKNVFANLVLGF